jgi:autotransporter-associated beta strand protein
MNYKPLVYALTNSADSICIFSLILLIAGLATPSFANTLYWVGDTNGATVSSPASGMWDASTTLSWNTSGTGTTNSTWATGDAAYFGGSAGSGALTVNLAANVNCSTLSFSNSDCAFTASSPEAVILPAGSGTAPNLVMDTAGTVTIGNNVTLESTATYVIYGTNDGTIDIASGGTILEPNSSTIDFAGILTYNLQAGGAVEATYVGSSTTGGFQVGALTGDNTTLNVNGGSVSLAGTNNMGIGIGAGTASTGTLTLNSGSVSMAASNTVRVMNVGSAAGSTGIVNLNGGLLAVTCVTNGTGTATVNFNGGTMEAVNGAFGPVFMPAFRSGTANVLSGGALINNNGFNITIAQPLVNGGGPDGGLTSSGSGSLTLTGANTYNGNTVINGGRLTLSGSASINTASIVVAGGATFDISALGSVTLASGQILSNSTSTATLDGTVNASVGTMSLTYVLGTPSFTVTNGTLTLSSGMVFQVNNTSPSLTAGDYELIAAKNGGLITGTLPSVTVGGSGLAVGTTAALQIIGGNLYLVVSGGTYGIASGDAAATINAFNSAFLYTSGNTAYYVSALNNSSPDYFWSQAEDIQAEESTYEHTGSSTDRTLVYHLCSTFLVNNALPWTWDAWNDDLGRVSTMLARGYLMTNNASFLTAAESGFNLAFSRGWDTNFNGGGMYEEMGVTNPLKESIASDSCGLAAARIYQAGGGSNYLNAAETIYNWERTVLFEPTTGKVRRGVYTNGVIDTSYDNFNQGMFLDFANYLYEITGNPMYFNDAQADFNFTQANLTTGGLLGAVGSLCRAMGDFVSYNNLWSTYYPWMLANANAAWGCRRTDLNISWNVWYEQTPYTNTLTPNACLGAPEWMQFVPASQPGFVACTNQLSGTAIGSAAQAGDSINNVFDGNLASYFYATTDSGGWVGLDLGTGTIIGQISYCPRPGSLTQMIGGVFQGDNNPQFSTPVTLDTITTAPPQYLMTPQTITNQTAFRYVRYVGPSGAYCAVAELKFYALNPAILQWNNAFTQLTWSGNGLLLEATNLHGPWKINAGATSPFQVTPTVSQDFFRVQSQ